MRTRNLWVKNNLLDEMMTTAVKKKKVTKAASTIVLATSMLWRSLPDLAHVCPILHVTATPHKMTGQTVFIIIIIKRSSCYGKISY